MRRTTLALDALPVMAWVSSFGGALEYVNDRYLAYTGLTREDIGADHDSVVHPDDVAAVAKVRSAQTPAEIEVRLRRRDGVFRWHLVKTAVLREEDGSSRAIVGTATDIDDQKRNAARLELLQRLTTDLVHARDAREASRSFLDAALAALDAVSGVVWLVDGDEQLAVSASTGVPEDFLAEWKVLRIEGDEPMMQALRQGSAVWIETLDDYRRATPDIADRAARANRPTSCAAVPLVIDQRRLGVAVFGYAGAHRFDDPEKHLVLTMCGHAAQALERARLLDAERRAIAALRLVAKVGATLSASLDVKETLTALARSVVPDLAEWCIVDVLVDGELQPLTRQHVDPSKLDLVLAYEKLRDAARSPSEALRRVLDTRTSLFVPAITDEMMRATDRSEEELAALAALELRSLIAVPLLIDAQPHGVVSFVRSLRSPQYQESDRALCEEIGRRAGLALTNAMLYEREQRARARLALLAAAGETFARSVDYDATLDAVVRITLPALADFAFFDVREADEVRRISAAHDDAETAALLAQTRWERSERTDVNLCALSTGAPAIHPSIDDAWMRDVATGEGHLAALRALRLASMVTVPLRLGGSGELMGALTLCYGKSRRRHTHEDLELAQELARRAAVAVEQARLHRETQIAAERAEEANRIKDEFLATVSHELRTPLNAIVGWAHMLDGDRIADPDFVRRGLDVIRRNARSQTKIVEEILDVSRIISGKLRLEPAEVDLAAVVREAMEAVRPAAVARRIELSFRSSGTTTVNGDAARLQQVAWNLLSNAVKFSADGGVVHVVVASDESGPRLTVADEGEGIAPELLPFVFDRFRQGDSSTTRAHGGLGLGLAIVRHIVELHGGRVTAASGGSKKGATFTVTLPAPDGAAASETTPTGRRRGPTPKSTPGMLSGTRVLVVEDDGDSRDLIDEVLSRAGADVVAACSVNDACAALERDEAFDVIVSDLGLPAEDGYELVRRVRAAPRTKTMFVIALSAYTRPQDRVRALEAGFDVHLAKPINPNELVLAVARVGR